MTLKDLEERVRGIYMKELSPISGFYASEVDDDGLMAVYRAGYKAGVNSFDFGTEPDLTIEEIDERLEMLVSTRAALDASIMGGGEMYRNSEVEAEKKAAWVLMYMSQVYMHGVLDEIKGLQKKKEEIHND